MSETSCCDDCDPESCHCLKSNCCYCLRGNSGLELARTASYQTNIVYRQEPIDGLTGTRPAGVFGDIQEVGEDEVWVDD